MHEEPPELQSADRQRGRPRLTLQNTEVARRAHPQKRQIHPERQNGAGRLGNSPGDSHERHLLQNLRGCGRKDTQYEDGAVGSQKDNEEQPQHNLPLQVES